MFKSSILMLVIAAGCNDSRATDSIEKELVFNKFNVEQPRGYLAYVENEVNICDYSL